MIEDNLRHMKTPEAQRFAESFDGNHINDEAIDQLPFAKPGDTYQLYTELVTPEVAYEITFTFERNGRGNFDFRLLPDNVDLQDDDGLGHLTFSTHANSPYYNLRHRFVSSGELGISGSDMLKKAEAFMKYLMQRHSIPEKDFFMNAGQERVIDWGLNNGYAMPPEEKARFDEIKSGHPDYVTEVTITNDFGWKRHGYIFKKELAEWAKITPCGRSGTESDITLHAERFDLIKPVTVN